MNVPPEIRRGPPASTLAWVAGVVGPRARVTRVRRLRSAWAAAMHAVDVRDGDRTERLVLRRWTRTDFPPDEGVVENEVAILRALEPSALPVPRLVAFDAGGDTTDVPAVLTTRLPGRDVLAPRALDTFLDRLAAILHEINTLPAPANARYDYVPYDLGIVTSPPEWTARPAVWARAIAITDEAMPAAPRVLCHRDFHPGNVLWARGRVSGVVDWTHACRGPAAAAVAHCRLNLAFLFDPDVADEFTRRYGPVDHLEWFDLAEMISITDPARELWRYHDAGRTDLTAAQVCERLDEFVERAVRRCDGEAGAPAPRTRGQRS